MCLFIFTAKGFLFGTPPPDGRKIYFGRQSKEALIIRLENQAQPAEAWTHQNYCQFWRNSHPQALVQKSAPAGVDLAAVDRSAPARAQICLPEVRPSSGRQICARIAARLTALLKLCHTFILPAETMRLKCHRKLMPTIRIYFEQKLFDF